MENNMALWDADNYIKLEDFEDVSEESVKEIRRVLKQQNLNKKISIEYDDIDLKINFNSASKYYPSQKIRRFDMDDDIHAIRYEGKQVVLYMHIGGWSTNPRIKNSHISIYTNSRKIGGDRFFQIELSDCIEDDNYIYILKKISKNTGSGAISRLNNSSYPTKEGEKRDKDLRERRNELVRRTYSDVINYNNNDWICIYKFDKEKLFDSSYHEELFNECIEKIIEFTFAMESIVVEAKKLGEFRQTTQKVDKLSNEALLSRIKKINKIPNKIETTQTSYVRNECITEYAKRRANGVCQLCREEAPFIDKKGRPYLEVHHITPLSEGGEDSIENTVALCPNCHRKMHSLSNHNDIQYLKMINSFEYISIKECAIDIGLEAYNVKVYSDGKIYGRIFNNKEDLGEVQLLEGKKIERDDIKRISDEIHNFDFRKFKLDCVELYKTCQPMFSMEVKYTDNITNDIYYDYGLIYEHILGKNKIDILKLKRNIEKILKIKSIDDLLKERN